ncbi:MAG: ABC transporter ATP-binding protein [Pseudomonadota bacterium]
MTPILILDGVRKSYGPLVAVDDFSLNVYPQEFVSIIGPSGCGKTVVLRMICGLEKPDSGNIMLRGQAVDDIPVHKRNLPLVFQSFALFPHMNVYKNIEFGLKMHRVKAGERNQRIMSTLKMLGMEDLSHRQVIQLSGGQMQRVGLARALVINPDILLLDDPLGALDAKIRISMQNELRQLQRMLKVTIVHVTNNQTEALVVADKILVMSKGKIEMVDTPDEVYLKPQTKFVARFVGKNNLLDGTVLGIVDDSAYVETELGTIMAKIGDRKPAANSQVCVVVKAESVKEDVSAPEYVNSLVGTLVGLEYQGSVVTYTLSLSNKQTIYMEKHESLSRHKPPSHGETLRVAWKAEDCYLIF